jgi:ribosome biogenesis GTPase / thiamine phosphate phosphatase
VPSFLDPLGWGPFFEAQLDPSDRSSFCAGRVVADRGPLLSARFDDGERVVSVPPRLRDAGEAPVVGDFVLAVRGDPPVVVRVLARRTRLSRGAAGRATAEQVIAANVDVAFVVQPGDAGLNARRLERTIAAVLGGGAEPVVLVTKLDLAQDPAAALAEAAAAAPGVAVAAASGLTGEGLEVVRAALRPARTGVFTGPSGAGKSTLVNALLAEAVQATAEVRARDRRGRHATTARRLFALASGGAVIDGPGLRELRLWDAGGIGGAFADVGALAQACRFRDCRHAGEPGCAVRAAVDDGALSSERLESLHKLEREAAALEARKGGAGTRAERARWRSIHKERRRFQRQRGR